MITALPSSRRSTAPVGPRGGSGQRLIRDWGIATKRKITIALDRLDRHTPFFMGAVTAPDGVELTPLEVGLAEPITYRD